MTPDINRRTPRPPAGPAAWPASMSAAQAPWASAARHLWRTDAALVSFALFMLALLLPASISWLIDSRLVHGTNAWVKPMKFMAATAVLALTVAWFAQWLSADTRRGRSYRALVATLIIAGGLEVAYITIMAGLGQASHFNTSSTLTRGLYSAMGVGALVLTATQPWLAVLLWKDHCRGVAAPMTPAFRHAVMGGLALSFVLGASVGMALGSRQPPAGMGLPLLGWHLGGGDLRPAHFIGLHAAQVLPLAAAFWAGGPWLEAQASRVRAGAGRHGSVVAVGILSVIWTGLFVLAFWQGLQPADL